MLRESGSMICINHGAESKVRFSLCRRAGLEVDVIALIKKSRLAKMKNA
jgi:hypothetical protein